MSGDEPALSASPDRGQVYVRLVTADFYMASPIPGLDPAYSSFRSSVVRRVPVIRIFGPAAAAASGDGDKGPHRKACLHVHGILPYLYLPKPESASTDPGFPHKMAAAIDKAVNLSFMITSAAPAVPAPGPSGGPGAATEARGQQEQQSTTGFQHVFKIVEVTGRPFYGYHAREHQFYKVFFYSPWMLKKAADLLQGGAVMGRVFQPHYSHVPYTLQFMMDYHLQGMGLVHLRHCFYRRGSQTLSHGGPSRENSISDHQLLNSDSLTRTTNTEVEMDCVAADILNSNQSLKTSASVLQPEDGKGVGRSCGRRLLRRHNLLQSSLSMSGGSSSTREERKFMNPGLEALWTEEALRRSNMGIDEELSPPSSPPRTQSLHESSGSQLFWSKRFEDLINQLEMKSERTPCPSSKVDPDSTYNFNPGSSSSAEAKHQLERSVYPAETLDETQFPEATGVQHHVASLCHSVSFGHRGEPSKELSSQEAQSETLSDDHLFSLEEGVGSRSDDEAVDELIDLLEGLEKQKVSEMDLQVSGAHHPEEMLHRQSLSPTTKGVHKFDLHSRRDELETWEMSQILWDDGDSTTDGQPVNLNPVQTRPISTKAPVDDGGDWSEDDSFWDKLNLNEL